MRAGLAAVLAGALACALLMAGGIRPVAAAEREYPTILAVGTIQPLGTHQGLPSPVIVADHQRSLGSGATVNARLQTSEGTLSYTRRLAPWLAGTAAYQLTVLTEGQGTDLYRDGRRLSRQAFEGDSQAARLGLGLFPEGAWRAGLEAERRQATFREGELTVPDYELPPLLTQDEARLTLGRHGWAGQEEAALTATAVTGHRREWRAWRLDPAGDGRTTYQRWRAQAVQPWQAGSGSGGKATLTAAGGSDLDLFNDVRVGGFASTLPVAGYYRNEFRARRATVLNLAHTWRLAEDRRLTLLADAATLEPLDLPYLAGTAETRTLAGIGIGWYHGIRALRGLPVILRYGEGLRVPEDSPEGYRRELLLVVAAGF